MKKSYKKSLFTAVTVIFSGMILGTANVHADRTPSALLRHRYWYNCVKTDNGWWLVRYHFSPHGYSIYQKPENDKIWDHSYSLVGYEYLNRPLLGNKSWSFFGRYGEDNYAMSFYRMKKETYRLHGKKIRTNTLQVFDQRGLPGKKPYYIWIFTPYKSVAKEGWHYVTNQQI